ncbi:hypothetical protein Acr_05g0014770 [Actinidia rufa]|uniref:Uncharacterized protein n=1 Tax=Actinidia rufa TaxID=165716 RepID=A0A7J0EMX8_9ERIC|nr:hypothetical protein Acr_05g0014770 [Actinidia rufa]
MEAEPQLTSAQKGCGVVAGDQATSDLVGDPPSWSVGLPTGLGEDDESQSRSIRVRRPPTGPVGGAPKVGWFRRSGGLVSPEW